MTNIFDYEFDGPRTIFTRYGESIERDEVVAILNYAIETLRELEVMALRGMNRAVVYDPDWCRCYRKIAAVLNYAEIGGALKQGQADELQT